MWEVLRAQSEEPPEMEIYRFHRELVGQIEVFVAQLGEVTLIERILLIILRHRLEFEQSCLSHKDRLNLEEVVTMVVHGIEWNTLRPLFKNLAIDAEAIVTGQGHEVGILPGTATQLCPSFDGLRLLLQPFSL